MADPTQGDTLMARKLANAQKRQGQERMTQLPAQQQPGRVPETSKTESGGGDGLRETPQPTAHSYSPGPSALVRSQLVVDPPPLPPPPDNWEDEERRIGSGGRTYTRAAFVPLVGTAEEWESLPRVRTGEYFRARVGGKRGMDMSDPRPPSAGKSESFPFRVLGPRDFYYRPDLDEQSQRVVIMSLVKQRQEESDRRAAIDFNRKVQLAKFDAQRRARLELQVRTGLKVDPKLLEAYNVNKESLTGTRGSPDAGIGETGADTLRRERGEARSRCHATWVESNQLRAARNMRHREYCRQRLHDMRLTRNLAEANLGTHYAMAKTQLLCSHGLEYTVGQFAASGGALALNCPTTDELRRSKKAADSAQKLRGEVQAERDRLMTELDTFDQELFSQLQGGKLPRQRGLPYSVESPHKTCAPQPGDRRTRDPPGHSAPTILDEPARAELRSRREEEASAWEAKKTATVEA
eukprot:Hpha_TRINITY_DN15419_c0_g3::TRINITY_DN15419_c0_g3_i1::g.177414::m.177414